MNVAGGETKEREKKKEKEEKGLYYTTTTTRKAGEGFDSTQKLDELVLLPLSLSLCLSTVI